MLSSLALIFLLSLLLGGILEKLKLPKLIAFILTGIILGPYALNILDNKLLSISSELRQLALVIILTRAGLSLNIKDLKQVGRPAILMCFIPAIFEILAFIIFGPLLFNLSLLDSAILGTVIAAVSPAIIVPRMIKLMEEGYGVKKSIPHLIMAGASVDDIFVIVLFTAFTDIGIGQEFSSLTLFKIPISIILGILIGVILGIIIINLFKKIHIRDTIKVVILLSLSFLLLSLESALENYIPFSALLSIMTIGIIILKKYEKLAVRLSSKYNKIWTWAEIILFALVGASVNINYAVSSGLSSVAIILIALFFRMLGVFISLIKTNLTGFEKLFCVFSYMPKATVQAAIGSIPLAMGFSSGETILTVSVMSILLTAPLGAILIDNTYKKLNKS
ncbi:MAG: cation:proton antiporter [Clostridium sp.]